MNWMMLKPFNLKFKILILKIFQIFNKCKAFKIKTMFKYSNKLQNKMLVKLIFKKIYKFRLKLKLIVI